jgi:hypothetical protein
MEIQDKLLQLVQRLQLHHQCLHLGEDEVDYLHQQLRHRHRRLQHNLLGQQMFRHQSLEGLPVLLELREHFLFLHNLLSDLFRHLNRLEYHLHTRDIHFRHLFRLLRPIKFREYLDQY